MGEQPQGSSVLFLALPPPTASHPGIAPRRGWAGSCAWVLGRGQGGSCHLHVGQQVQGLMLGFRDCQGLRQALEVAMPS